MNKVILGLMLSSIMLLALFSVSQSNNDLMYECGTDCLTLHGAAYGQCLYEMK